MTAKEYLNQVQKLNSLIANKLAEIEYWKDVAKGTTANSKNERVQATSSKQKMADAVCKYLQMEVELNNDIDRLIDLKQEIISTIEQIPAIEYDVLHKIYVQGKEFFEIADDYKKSYSWATSVHGRGLISVQKILDEREKNETFQKTKIEEH